MRRGAASKVDDMTVPILLMYLAIGIAAALATVALVAVVLIDRSERQR